jgi:DNA-binding NtrC family response regulator
MNEIPTILIADRNSHVRMFLMRELMAAGYRVQLAATAESVLKIVYAQRPINLLILDPDLPGIEPNTLLEKLADRIPALPVVLHTHRSHDEALFTTNNPWVTVIEKDGDSVVRIKEIVGKLLSSFGREGSEARRFNYREGELS